MTRPTKATAALIVAILTQSLLYRVSAEEALLPNSTTPPPTAVEIPGTASQAPNAPKPKVIQSDHLTAEQVAIRNEAIKLNNDGLQMSQQGDYRGAIKKFDQALQKDPDVAIPYLNRALAKIYLKELDGAIADCDKLVALGESNLLAEAYCNRGLAKVHKGDNQAALADLDKALELKPKWPDALVNRSLARFKSGDKKGAMADLDATLAIDPNNKMAKQNKSIMGSNAQAIVGLTETHVSEKEVTNKRKRPATAKPLPTGAKKPIRKG